MLHQEAVTQIAPSHTPAQLQALVHKQKAFFDTGITKGVEFRKAQLRVIRKLLQRYEPAITAALHQDLGKDAFESYATEIGQLYNEITTAEKQLKTWMQPIKKSTPIAWLPSSSSQVPHPRGNTLIIAPWNYPAMLLLRPLIGAIVAGCTAIIKPSEESSATEQVLRKMIEETYEEEYIAVVTGTGAYIHEHLTTQHKFDLIFFTGSPNVGKIIMQAAAKNLTPVVLELGGKSPAIVAEDAAINYTAKKIILGKLLNTGQTCIAVDYVLVHENVKDKLVAALKNQLQIFYGEDAEQSPHYGRIINTKHYQRIKNYLQDGTIIHGGQYNDNTRYIAPTILENVALNSAIMQEEIFGPLLPIVTFKHVEDAKYIIENNPSPLALYIFSSSRAVQQYFVQNIQFGGGCINNVLIHLSNPNLPLGGVNNSGIGSYFGKASFDAFTHYKSIVKSPTWFDAPVLYPPHKPWHYNLLRKLIK